MEGKVRLKNVHMRFCILQEQKNTYNANTKYDKKNCVKGYDAAYKVKRWNEQCDYSNTNFKKCAWRNEQVSTLETGKRSENTRFVRRCTVVYIVYTMHMYLYPLYISQDGEVLGGWIA